MDALIYGAIAGAATLAGIALVLRWRDWTIRNSHVVNSLAAGAMMGVAFFSLLPEAAEMCKGAMPLALAGFVALYLVETVVVFHGGGEIHYEHEHDHGKSHESRAWTVFAGLFLHSLVDGLVIGVGFEVDHAVGVLAAGGVILHELPEGATTFALLAKHVSRRTALILSALVAVATPAGAAAGLAFLPGTSAPVLGGLLAVTAGTFVYVAASDLIPETHGRHSRVNAAVLLVGVALAWGLSLMHGA